MATLYSGGRVIDGAGTVLDEHGVLVEGAVIARIAPLAEFAGFEGERVDTTGGTLLPGLVDCHVHLCYGAEGNPWASMIALRESQLTMKALERVRQVVHQACHLT